MYFPSTVRTNMRYRGPVESHKMAKNGLDMYGDIKRLYQIFDHHQTLVQSLQQSAREGDHEINGIIGVSNKMRNMNRRINILKGGMRHV